MFRRKRHDEPVAASEIDDSDITNARSGDLDDADSDAVSSGAAQAAHGPYDAESAPADEIPRIDLGALQVPLIDGLEVRLDIDEATALPAEPGRGFPADLKTRLHAAVDALSEKLRPVFLMHDVEGYTHEEIATSLGIPVGTSKARLFDARAKLRMALAAFAGDHIA